MRRFPFNPVVANVCMTVALMLGTANRTEAQLIFFGEDLNNSEVIRKVPHPNSDAARANFLANLTGVGTENFDSIATGTGVPLALTFPGAGTATLTGSGFVATIPSGTNSAGRYPISGNNYFDVDATAFVITFSQPVAAMGFYGVDIGDFGGQLTLTLTDGTVKQFTVPNTIGSLGSTGGSVLYFGIIDTANPWIQATFGNSSGGTDVFAFDDFTIGSVQQVAPAQGIPEPASVLLLGVGCLSLVGYAGRRRKQGA